MKPLAAALVAGVLLSSTSYAQNADLIIERALTPPKIDGVLDDELWAKVTPLPVAPGDWVSYNPVRGDKMTDLYRTEARVAYDDRNIYFAFHCFDNEPDKIRSNVSRRDSAFNDDWIALSLDSAGTGQSAYHLFSNPSGSQMDAINTAASGEQFDADVVWYSVANKTSDGYVVEVQVPLQTLRFKAGDPVRMGLVFFRKVSRTGVSYAWPEMLPGQWVFDRPSQVGITSGFVRGMDHPGIAASLTAVHEQPGAPWTLDTLARTAAMSRSSFAARFHELVGETPAAYVAGYRIALAQQRLRSGEQVATIAPELGYANGSGLSRAFRAHVGVSPSAWLAGIAADDRTAPPA